MKKKKAILLIAAAMIVFISGRALVSNAAVGNPSTSGDVTTWDCVYFGHYPQSHIDQAPADLESSYNLEQVKWRVLNVKDNKALLLADKVIDAAKFSDRYTHKYVYADAPIFSHMEELKKKLFTSQEASALCSKDTDNRISEPGLLLLPSKEIMKNTDYGFPANEDRTNTRGAGSTDYVKQFLGYGKGYWIKYWLSDLNPGDHGVVFTIDNEGKIDYLNNENYLGIRPVAVLDLSKAVWYDAGTVNSNGEVILPENEAKEESSNQETPSSETPSAEEDSKAEMPAAAGTDLKASGTTYTVVSEGTVSFKKPKSTSTAVTIPAEVKINGVSYKITAISANAFKNNKKITKVTIGKNVTSIGVNAFNGCTKLKSVTIGSKVATIGNGAFAKCTALTKINLPASVKKVGKNAFSGCKKLKKITIQTTRFTAKTVGANAFKGINEKASIKCPKSKKAAYRKFLLKKGMKKTMTFK